jgi:uncharacterized protein (DUF433 family)
MIDTAKSEIVLAGPNGEGLIRKTPGVCGGGACIRNTRIPVWSLVESRKSGISDRDLLNSFDPPLAQTDLAAAWAYYESHQTEIEQNIWENQACMVEHVGAPPPAWLVVLGRRLGLSDERIRNGFVPPLSQAELTNAWDYYAKHKKEVEQDIRRNSGA